MNIFKTVFILFLAGPLLACTPGERLGVCDTCDSSGNWQSDDLGCNIGFSGCFHRYCDNNTGTCVRDTPFPDGQACPAPPGFSCVCCAGVTTSGTSCPSVIVVPPPPPACSNPGNCFLSACCAGFNCQGVFTGTCVPDSTPPPPPPPPPPGPPLPPPPTNPPILPNPGGGKVYLQITRPR